MPGKPFVELCLEDFFESEALRDAEGHGDDGNDGDQRVEGQGRCAEPTPVFVKAPDGKDDDPQELDEKRLFPGKRMKTDPPDIRSDKGDEFQDQGYCFPNNEHYECLTGVKRGRLFVPCSPRTPPVFRSSTRPLLLRVNRGLC